MASRVAASGNATGGVAVAVVVGDEELLVERAVARLVAAASVAAGQGGSAGAVGVAHPAGDGVHDVAGGALSPGDLTSLTAPSLFGGGSLVVIRDAHHASKDVTEELARLAAEPPPGVRLVVTHAGGGKGKALLASLAGSGARVIECPKITRVADRMDFVRREFRAAGRAVDDGGVRALIDALGSDLREIASACAQLAADTTGVIDQSVVARYYRGRAEASGFSVADRAVEGRLSDALELLRWALAVGVAPVRRRAREVPSLRPRPAPRRGRSTGCGSSCAGGSRTASRGPSVRWQRPTRRSRGRERAPVTRWRWRSGPS